MNSVYRESAIVEKECKRFSQTDRGRRQRSVSLSRSGSTRSRSFSTPRTSYSAVGAPGPQSGGGQMSAVQRQRALMDQKAIVLR